MLDIAVSKAAGQSRGESLTHSELVSASTEQEKLENPVSIKSCQTGLPNPNSCPLVKLTEELRKELDWQPDVKREEPIPPSDPAQLQGPVSSVVCHLNCSSEQQPAHYNCLAISYGEVSMHPSLSSQDFPLSKAVEESKRSFDVQSEEEEELEELSPPS